MAEQPGGPAVHEREVAEERREYPLPPEQQVSALAIASLATGIAAWFIFPFIGAITAVVTGALAGAEIRQANGRLTGAPMATAGIVLGGVQLGLIILGVILVAIFASAFGPGFSTFILPH